MTDPVLNDDDLVDYEEDQDEVEETKPQEDMKK
eukprot:CAMPEP_0119311450 /NCGR_PEP_ID=MMETSP1333-20130426/22435_1 /TAXON_ID=418940 /ORGANISM="Scyphosphaera apsteinii, Strain RCC1455" /LENGTH=32 /DNA_ID= /DNA_START= /DNA_END= /DNA_ORIENTATION=